MRPRVVVSLLGLLAACAPSPAVLSDPVPIAIAAPQHPPSPDVIDTTPAPPRVGPVRRESPILFQPSLEHAVLAPVSRSVRTWAVERDGTTRIEVGCRRGVSVVDGPGRKTIARDATHVVIAPLGTELAHERGGRIVRTTAGGAARGAPLEGTDAMYLDAPEAAVLAFHRGCEWFAATDGGAEVSLGSSCGALVRAERGRPRLWIAELDRTDPVRGTRAIVGFEPGQEPVTIDLSASPGMTAPAMSADASIVCGTFVEATHPVLSCRLREGGGFEQVAKDVFGTAQFADDARRLVYTHGDREHVPRELHLVDFDHRIVRRLGRIAHHRLMFLPGGEHVVAYDGARGLVFELDTGWVTPFGEEGDDWVALGPGDRPGTFLASRLRSRCTELVRVGLPARDDAP